MSDIRSLLDRWTAIITISIFLLSIYPSFVVEVSIPIETYIFNIGIILLFVLATQWAYRLLIRPVPKEYKLGILTRRVFALSILAGTVLRFWSLYQQASGPAYEWTGGFLTVPLISYGLIYGLIISLFVGGVKLIMRRVGLSLPRLDSPDSTRALDRLTEHYDTITSGGNLLCLSDERWISRMRLLVIRWVFVVGFISYMTRTSDPVETLGGLLGVVLVYALVLRLASSPETPEAVQQTTGEEPSEEIVNDNQDSGKRDEEDTIGISHETLAEKIKETEPGHVITKREFMQLASPENAEKWWEETAKPALMDSDAIEQDGSTGKRWRVQS